MANIDPLASSSFSVASVAAQTAGLSKKKETSNSKTGSLKSRFSELLSKNDTSQDIDSDFPAEIANMQKEEAISFLLDAVTVAADQVKQSPFGGAFVEYRKKVSQFMKYVVKNSYDVEMEESARSPRIMRRKKYYLVSVVDEKLDQLAKDILFNQTDQLNLLARIEEINGMLVDLTM